MCRNQRWSRNAENTSPENQSVQAGQIGGQRFCGWVDVPVLLLGALHIYRRWLVWDPFSHTRGIPSGISCRFQGVSTVLVLHITPQMFPSSSPLSQYTLLLTLLPPPHPSYSHSHLPPVYPPNLFHFPFPGRSMWPP